MAQVVGKLAQMIRDKLPSIDLTIADDGVTIVGLAPARRTAPSGAGPGFAAASEAGMTAANADGTAKPTTGATKKSSPARKAKKKKSKIKGTAKKGDGRKKKAKRTAGGRGG